MRVRVYYKDGKAVDFVVPEDILVVDFSRLAEVHGKVKKVEFL